MSSCILCPVSCIREHCFLSTWILEHCSLINCILCPVSWILESILLKFRIVIYRDLKSRVMKSKVLKSSESWVLFWWTNPRSIMYSSKIWLPWAAVSCVLCPVSANTVSWAPESSKTVPWSTVSCVLYHESWSPYFSSSELSFTEISSPESLSP